MESVADVIDRWYAIPGTPASGLYGGQFSHVHDDRLTRLSRRVWSLKLNHPVGSGH